MNSEGLAKKIEALLESNKAEDVRVYDVRGRSNVTDYYIAATGLSTPHLRSLSSAVRAALKSEGIPGYKASGEPESGWVVLDYIDVIAHLFIREAREYYDLDSLWGDVKNKSENKGE